MALRKRGIVVAIGFGIAALIGLRQYATQPAPTAASPSIVRPPSVPKPAAEQAIDRGHNMLALMANADAAWPGDAWFDEALAALRAVPPTAPEHAQAVQILSDYEMHHAAWRAAHDAAAAKVQAARQEALHAAQEIERIAYRGKLEDVMLSKGINVDITLAGKQHDRLTIKYALASKVTAYQFSHSEFPQQWSAMGFRKVTLTDGYDEAYEWVFER